MGIVLNPAFAHRAVPVSPCLMHKVLWDVRRVVDVGKLWEGTYDWSGCPRCMSRGQSQYVHRTLYEDFHVRLELARSLPGACGGIRAIRSA